MLSVSGMAVQQNFLNKNIKDNVIHIAFGWWKIL